MVKRTSLPVNFTVNNYVENEDTRFLNITIDILNEGLNYNDSVFTKEVVDANIDSLKNTPVLGFIEYNKNTGEDDFRGHEYVLTKNENGIERKYIGQAFGVISESCSPRWIEKECSDGVTRNTLQCDALLWTKFDAATEIMARDFSKSQSMELEVNSVDGYEDEDGIFYFTAFKFNGCCLLGDDKEPAMIDSVAYIKDIQFTVSDFVQSVQSELEEKCLAYSKINNTDERGCEEMPNQNEINTDYTMSLKQQFENIRNIVSNHEVFTDRWGDEISRYALEDIQDNEIIVVDRMNNYQIYGMTFLMDGDEPVIDFECAKRKKVTYSDYEDCAVVEDSAFSFGAEIENIETKAFDKVNAVNEQIAELNSAVELAESNYTALKEEYDEIKPKYDEFVHAEQERQERELDALKDAEFTRFEATLGENPDFIEMKSKKAEMSVDDITAQCSILFTRLNLEGKINFSKDNSQPMTVGIIEDSLDNAGYVYSERYGNIPVHR